MAAPYPLLEKIISYARLLANDVIQQLGGNTLTDTADFTPYYVNLAWLQMQQELASNGYDRFRTDNLILTLPPVNGLDTALQVTLDWDGYNDGVNDDASIALPQTLIRALKIAERPSGTAPNTAQFIDMDGPEQGIRRIPSIQKQQWNGIWIWDDDKIYMPGALVTTDIRIDYLSYLPDFTGTGVTFPAGQTADILRCEDAFAKFIAAVFCGARGDVDASGLLQAAKDAAKILAGGKPAEMPVGVAQ